MTFVANWRGVGVSFFRLALYPLAQTPYLLDGVPIATIEEIGAMKLAAIMSRTRRTTLTSISSCSKYRLSSYSKLHQ
ncbi:hypothetical protein [Candidatus Amarolinea dominans]|uniref:hypothetical protein n=1 Tax=Candidatus Amarolinea dominans TaxID=3140696 RepID=UPI001D5C8ACB|nr:hypothetical protein [Anaerolineae bacterium]